MGRRSIWAAACAAVFAPLAVPAAPVFINEIHYDNAGIDAGEFVEVAGPAGTDLTGWRVVRYNGANGQVYTSPAAIPPGSDVFSGAIPDLGGGFGVLSVSFDVNNADEDIHQGTRPESDLSGKSGRRCNREPRTG